jgi:hypothetical protein
MLSRESVLVGERLQLTGAGAEPSATVVLKRVSCRSGRVLGSSCAKQHWPMSWPSQLRRIAILIEYSSFLALLASARCSAA